MSPPPDASGAPSGERLILVGRVAGAFGVRGELRITAYTDDPLALAAYGSLRRQSGAPALTLQRARRSRPGRDDGELVASATEVRTREEAEALRGLELYIPRSALPPPEPDDFYHADLIGLRAVTRAGAELGRVRAVHDFGAGDILEIAPAGGGASLLLAFTRDVAPEIDLARGLVVIAPPGSVEDAPPPPGDPAP